MNPVGLAVGMTPAGALELPLLAAQIVTSILATWAGIRIVDDVRHLIAVKARRTEDRI